jgi:hypothetical protein
MTDGPELQATRAEEWRVIAFAPDYAVSSLGRVKRIKADSLGRGKGKMLKLPVGDAGYPCCSIHVDRKQHHRRVYRLVADAFLGPKPTPKHEVRHLDGDHLNTRADNLAWGTSAENKADCLRHGTRSWGERRPMAKLTEQAVIEIRRSKEMQKSLAARYGVTQGLVSAVKLGKVWKHVAA